MDCDDCIYGPLCVKVNPPPELKDYYDWEREAREDFISHIYPFIKSAVIISGERTNLFGKGFSVSDLFRWEQRQKKYPECFKSNNVITLVADMVLITCV